MPYVPKTKNSKKRRVPVQARAIERVNKILDVAAKLMADPEQEKVTTHLIAELAEVSVGSVYQFFPNVESVKIALIERLLDQYYDQFDKVVSSSPDIKDLGEFVALLVNATHDFYQQHPDVIRLIVASSHLEEFHEVNSGLNERVRNRVLAYFNAKDFDLPADVLMRKVAVVIAISDAMTMFIWSTESQAERDAYLADWRGIVAMYAKTDF